MPIYQIRDWNVHFENNKSRIIEHCGYVAMPNKQHGMGFIRVITSPGGAAMFGIWTMIVQACSQQRKPRLGWLTDDGTETGRAWTLEDMALRWRQSPELILQTLQLMASQQVGWLNALEVPEGGTEVPDTRHLHGTEVPPNGQRTELPELPELMELQRGFGGRDFAPEFLNALKAKPEYSSIDIDFQIPLMREWYARNEMSPPGWSNLVSWLDKVIERQAKNVEPVKPCDRGMTAAQLEAYWNEGNVH
jgi:hypothetical protein